MAIAWTHLSLEQQAQILHLRADLAFERDLAMGIPPRCQRDYCHGSLFPDEDGLKCHLCSRTFDQHGNEIKLRTEPVHIGAAFHRI